MKNSSSYCKILFVIGLSFLFGACATQKEKQARINLIDSLVKSDNFKFVAQQATPLRGNIVSQRLLQLDGSYYLKVNKDTLNAYLPYFGVAQQAPYGTTDNGIQFITTDFDYNKTKKTKGFEITIVPKKTDKANRLFLTVSESGTATLHVNSNNRDAISFSGTIEKP
ncbi:MAG TPA: DUF4251 domain-containing protein [Pelobium sp.]|nr:DUF4251 domain-containing protein [Pelobium sp.]